MRFPRPLAPLGLLGVLALAAAAPAGAASPAAALPRGVAEKLDTRLLPALRADAEPAPVWVEFADKGETSPGDLAARLAEAEASLSPRNRARRERTGVQPLVDYRDLPVHPPYLEELRGLGLAPYGVSRWFNQAAVRSSGASLAAIAALPFVQRLSPVEKAVRGAEPETQGIETDAEPARFATPASVSRTQVAYGLATKQVQQMNAIAVNDSGYIGTGVLVCLLDEGFNRFDKHEALISHVIPAGRLRDFVQGDGDPTDTTSAFGFSHGTWTMSCLGGNKPGTFVGPGYGVDFALGRTENSFSEHQVEMVYWGMGAEWADSLGADLISSSLGYNTFDSPDPSYTYADMNGHTTIVSRAAEIAASKGILVVNSAGNEGNNLWHYILAPADVHGDSLIAVGAVDSTGAVASFSSYGPTADGRVKPDLAARGVLAWMASSSNPTGYLRQNGTSFSCPLVAGLAACLIQARPSWPPRLIIGALRASASKATTPDNRVGYGIPDGLAALRWIPDTMGVPGAPSTAFALSLAGQNPMRAGAPTTVRFALGRGLRGPASARLRVFDAQGRFIRTLWSGLMIDGQYYFADWDGRDDDGRPVQSGLYFIALDSRGRQASLRIANLR